MKKYLKFCCSALAAFLIVANAVDAQARESAIASIWNPSTVDWWVASGDDESDTCQIHWLFDDRFDVYLKQNTQGHYYLGLQEGADSFVGELKGYLIVDDAEVSLGVQNIGNGQVVAVVPPSLNEFDYVRKAKIFLLKSADVLYNFPLENSRENFKVYDQCLIDNGQKKVVERVEPVRVDMPANISDENMEAEKVSQPLPPSSEMLKLPENLHGPSDSIVDDVETDYNVRNLGLFGEGADGSVSSPDVNQGEEYVSQVLDEISTPEQSLTPIAVSSQNLDAKVDMDEAIVEQLATQSQQPPSTVPPFYNKAKQSDDLQAGLEGIDTFSEEKEVREKKREKAAVLTEYDAKSTSIIRNLTRKLSVLEKEKEELRKRLLASNDASVISEIASCKDTSSVEEEDVALSEDLIDEFETIISELRAENELLNAAVMDGGEAGVEDAANSSILQDEIDGLKRQINELELDNAGLNKSIKDYRSMMDDWQKGADITEEQVQDAVDEAQTSDVDAILDAAEAEWGDEIERDVLDQSLDILGDSLNFEEETSE